MLWMVLSVWNMILNLVFQKIGYFTYHGIIVGACDSCLWLVRGVSFVGWNENVYDIFVLSFVRNA